MKKTQVKKAKETVYILENKINQIPIKRSSIVPHDKFSQNVKERNLKKIIHPGCLMKKWSVLSKIIQFCVEIDVFFQYRVQICTFYEQNFLIKD